MSNQVRPATASGSGPSAESMGAGASSASPAPFVSQVPGTQVHFPTYHGRTVSWVAVTLIVVAFVAGGLALVFGPTWWLFWVSLGVAAIGALLALATNIFEDWY
jgi:hypothetical protein